MPPEYGELVYLEVFSESFERARNFALSASFCK